MTVSERFGYSSVILLPQCSMTLFTMCAELYVYTDNMYM